VPISTGKQVETAEDLLQWCRENGVLPNCLDEDDIKRRAVGDVGCGCCSVDVQLTQDVIEAFKRYMPSEGSK